MKLLNRNLNIYILINNQSILKLMNDNNNIHQNNKYINTLDNILTNLINQNINVYRSILLHNWNKPPYIKQEITNHNFIDDLYYINQRLF